MQSYHVSMAVCKHILPFSYKSNDFQICHNTLHSRFRLYTSFLFKKNKNYNNPHVGFDPEGLQHQAHRET